MKIKIFVTQSALPPQGMLTSPSNSNEPSQTTNSNRARRCLCSLGNTYEKRQNTLFLLLWCVSIYTAVHRGQSIYTQDNKISNMLNNEMIYFSCLCFAFKTKIKATQDVPSFILISSILNSFLIRFACFYPPLRDQMIQKINHGVLSACIVTAFSTWLLITDKVLYDHFFRY